VRKKADARDVCAPSWKRGGGYFSYFLGSITVPRRLPRRLEDAHGPGPVPTPMAYARKTDDFRAPTF